MKQIFSTVNSLKISGGTATTASYGLAGTATLYTFSTTSSQYSKIQLAGSFASAAPIGSFRSVSISINSQVVYFISTVANNQGIAIDFMEFLVPPSSTIVISTTSNRTSPCNVQITYQTFQNSP